MSQVSCENGTITGSGCGNTRTMIEVFQAGATHFMTEHRDQVAGGDLWGLAAGDAG